jgi:hypothetical protein
MNTTITSTNVGDNGSKSKTHDMPNGDVDGRKAICGRPVAWVNANAHGMEHEVTCLSCVKIMRKAEATANTDRFIAESDARLAAAGIGGDDGGYYVIDLDRSAVMSLDARMYMEHVIMVRDGVVSDVLDKYAPEVYVTTDSDGQILSADTADMVEMITSQGWTVMDGWSGQWHYSGPIMHVSEYIGGALETHIMENDGYYVACSVDILPTCENGEMDVAGWILLFQPFGNE